MPTWSILHARHWKAADRLPRPALPRRDVRRARQRPLGPPGRAERLRGHRVRRRRGRGPGRDRHGPGGRRGPVDGCRLRDPPRGRPSGAGGRPRPVRVRDPAPRRTAVPEAATAIRAATATMPSRTRCPTTRAGRSTTPTTGGATGPAFAQWFASEAIFTEPHSTKPIEDAVGWMLETDPETIIATERAPYLVPPDDWDPPPSEQDRATAFAQRVTLPVAPRPRDDDEIIPIRYARRLAARARRAAHRGRGRRPLDHRPRPGPRQPADPRLRARARRRSRDDRRSRHRPTPRRRQRACALAGSDRRRDRRRWRPTGLRRVRHRRPDDRAAALGPDHPRPPVEGPDRLPEPVVPASSRSTAAATAAPTGRPIRPPTTTTG